MNIAIQYHEYLPGIRELSMIACCLFGIQPNDPALEKEYIMELQVKRHSQAPQTRLQPYGPIGTEWNVIIKNWWDNWRFYVGHKRVITSNNNNNNTSSLSEKNSNHTNSPGEIENWTILKKNNLNQLLNGITLHQHIEVISPAVYHALYKWYGGGPSIIRKVISTSSSSLSSNVNSNTNSNTNMNELELFPLYLKISTCDSNGKIKDSYTDILFSRMNLISQLITELSILYNLDESKIRLWNYLSNNWKEQYILISNITLDEAKLQEDQVILMEISLNDGTWPRSQLHAILDEEERNKVHKNHNNILTNTMNNMNNLTLSMSSDSKSKYHDGKIGLDNLG